MGSLRIPTQSAIATMSLVVCQRERTRLRNEISFARGNAMWGGPVKENEETIRACNEAIAAIESRLAELARAINFDTEASRVKLWSTHTPTPL